ncbi:hypothetical protein M758_6G065600 [Ceratodon purpureus]|uniref:Uncharacterized protein n=1 Tax=Ceratodon purpureus TaxID=3225 RepID=A0A8T0HGG0_CERPU|nr:hypothetical protein KC19_6G069700 [Ceratodon purpureus]KAG0612955.1 hypothetical protein M758_6G065600 [Ceratodon purpureus]
MMRVFERIVGQCKLEWRNGGRGLGFKEVYPQLWFNSLQILYQLPGTLLGIVNELFMNVSESSHVRSSFTPSNLLRHLSNYGASTAKPQVLEDGVLKFVGFVICCTCWLPVSESSWGLARIWS